MIDQASLLLCWGLLKSYKICYKITDCAEMETGVIPVRARRREVR